MLEGVKKNLARIKNSPPGTRFAEQHRRAKKNGLASGWGRAVCVTLSLVSLVIGVVLVFIPGPAILFFLVSAVLLASQWRSVAVLMDRAELKGRGMWKDTRNFWRKHRPSSAK